MKARIEVKDRTEARAIRAGLKDEALRALVVVMGKLGQRRAHELREYLFEHAARPTGPNPAGHGEE